MGLDEHMNCTDVAEQLSLYLYGELSGGEEESLRKHLDECAGCRQLLEREKTLHRALDSASASPPLGMLERCRRELQPALENERRSRGLGWTWKWFPVANWLRPAAAVALVALGFFAGRLTDGGHPGTVGEGPGNLASRVQRVETAPNGELQVVVEDTSQRVIEGTLDDPAIRSLLVSALLDSTEPAVRLDSVELLKSRSNMEEVREAILLAAEADSNEAVRLTALEALRPYVDEPRSRQVLSRVLLRDRNDGVRAVAMEMLTETPRPEVVGVLQDLLTTEGDGYLRERSQQVLRTMNASLETF